MHADRTRTAIRRIAGVAMVSSLALVAAAAHAQTIGGAGILVDDGLGSYVVGTGPIVGDVTGTLTGDVNATVINTDSLIATGGITSTGAVINGNASVDGTLQVTGLTQLQNDTIVLGALTTNGQTNSGTINTCLLYTSPSPRD